MNRLKQAWLALPVILLASCAEDHCDYALRMAVRAEQVAAACEAHPACNLTAREYETLLIRREEAAVCKGKRSGE